MDKPKMVVAYSGGLDTSVMVKWLHEMLKLLETTETNITSWLADVVDFYNTRFNIGLTPQEKSDLVAFLGAL